MPRRRIAGCLRFDRQKGDTAPSHLLGSGFRTA